MKLRKKSHTTQIDIYGNCYKLFKYMKVYACIYKSFVRICGCIVVKIILN